mmetsp:Transcript_25322/g.74359  ORF Transcript_25322/g.74359 Transcript_25322/m.74359 type:complete len:207 (+) Transcript_25322:117-737(+)
MDRPRLMHGRPGAARGSRVRHAPRRLCPSDASKACLQLARRRVARRGSPRGLCCGGLSLELCERLGREERVVRLRLHRPRPDGGYGVHLTAHHEAHGALVLGGLRLRREPRGARALRKARRGREGQGETDNHSQHNHPRGHLGFPSHGVVHVAAARESKHAVLRGIDARQRGLADLAGDWAIEDHLLGCALAFPYGRRKPGQAHAR